MFTDPPLLCSPLSSSAQLQVPLARTRDLPVAMLKPTTHLPLTYDILLRELQSANQTRQVDARGGRLYYIPF